MNELEQTATGFYKALYRLLWEFDGDLPTMPWGLGIRCITESFANDLFFKIMERKGYKIYDGEWIRENLWDKQLEGIKEKLVEGIEKSG